SVKHGVDVLIVAADPFFDSQRERIVALATRHGVAALYAWREYVLAGGLMSYGTDLPDSYRQAATYACRILKGENAANLPVMQPTKFQLAVNLKTARALRLTGPAHPARPRRRGDRVSRRIDRRDFIMLLGGAAVAWTLAARAQPAGKVWRIGMLDTTGEAAKSADISAFRRGLAELGYTEEKNLIIDYRSADGRPERFPALVAELLSRKVDLIVTRGTPAAVAAKEATSTIPVVMAAVADPLLVVRSLARPGGNLTGFSSLLIDLPSKQAELVKEMVPGLTRVGSISNMS